MKRCPDCRGEVKAEAVVCKHCGSDVAAPVPAGRTSELAVASLVCSVAGAASFFPAALVLGLVLGYMARREIRESRGRLSGENLASAGIITGWAGAAVNLLMLAANIAWVLLAAAVILFAAFSR